MAKGQGREKPRKIEQRKVQGLKRGPQVEQTALPASPIYIGQAHGEEKKYIKRGAKGPGVSLPLSCSLALSLSHSLSLSHALSLFVSFRSACAHALRMYFPLFSK